MNRFQILVTDGLAEEGLALLSSVGEVVNNPKLSLEEVIAVLPEMDALVVRSKTKVKANVIQAGRKLKVIGRAGVGVDNIDVAAAVAHGITVVNSPLAATNAVAELTLGVMLVMARQVMAADASLKQQKWEKSAFKGSELSGKKLGLVGVGRIGTRVAELAQAFGMTVIGHDVYVTEDVIRQHGIEPAGFHEVLQAADYLSLHLPLTQTTRNMISRSEFAMMKKGARLVCLARGGVVDEDALRAALDSDHLAGAALDVFALEPPPAGSIVEHPKVVATPHIGAQTEEAQTRAGIAIAEEVITVLQGKEPRWRVLSND